MLGLGRVLVEAAETPPDPVEANRAGELHRVGVGAGTILRQPVGQERAVSGPRHRGEVGPVGEQGRVGDHGDGLAPASLLEPRQAQQRLACRPAASRRRRLQPGEQQAAVAAFARRPVGRHRARGRRRRAVDGPPRQGKQRVKRGRRGAQEQNDGTEKQSLSRKRREGPRSGR